MQRKFLEFIDVLRDANVTISTDEVLALFQALPHVPADDKTIFRQALKTSLIKDYTDIPVFDRCFTQFFEGISGVITDVDDLEALRKNSAITSEQIKDIENRLDDFIESLGENLIFEKNPQEIFALFIEELQESASSGGSGMAIFQTSRSRVRTQYGQGEEGQEGDDLGELKTILIRMIDQKMKKRKVGREIREREEYLLNKYIYQLKPDEVKEMRELVRRFGQKLKNRISLRKKRVKHGGIDIKRTFRSSLEFGGIPFKIFFKDKKIDRPQLVVLCDVSGSVNQYTRFMLLLTHTLQSLFSKVRTFAFISNLVEITDRFMEMDPERAINTIFHDTDFTFGWGSNYGRSFDQFMENFSDSLNSKTTVLILGDARNNNQDPGINSFIRISEKARNVFWLNPEKKHLWNWSDSIASLYIPYCREMKEVNNFLDLSKFIDKLFLDYTS
ncbi:MAG TPA: VWA domain-containing protein [Spirochaetota bacterium]|nr:VWA domain-containing protein [Spirochaetota bacterium]HPI88127.1 VWA domain-containing protein [Spirochaetota bacterium]HPR47902.1 VWA domain-containing protein [Spirochaetota bacterium]